MFFKNLILMLFLISIALCVNGRAWGAELATNGDFENVTEDGTPVDWKISPSTVYYGTVLTPVQEGDRAAFVTKIENRSGWTLIYQQIKVVGVEGKEQSYTFSGYGRIHSSANIDYIKLRIKWSTGDNSDSTDVTTKGSWEFMSVTDTAPTGAIWAQIQCYVMIESGGSTDYPAYFDDIHFTGPLSVISAVAEDTSGGGDEIQAGDTVTLTFNQATNGFNVISGEGIDKNLDLTPDHTWGAISSSEAVWSSVDYTYDTLTITLDTDANVESGDTITIKAVTIKDATGTYDADDTPVTITGLFGPSPYVGKVLINEVCVTPKQDWNDSEEGVGVAFDENLGTGSPTDTDEYIEIYNNFESAIDLTGWTIEMTDSSPGTDTLGASYSGTAYFGISGLSDSWDNFQDKEYLVLGNPTGSMNQSIWIVLKDANGLVIDDVELGIEDFRGDYDEEDPTTYKAPKGNNTGLSDEVVARDADSTDTGVDADDFAKKSASPGAQNLDIGLIDITSGVLCGTADQANVKVTDADIAGDGTITVIISSDADGASDIELILEEIGSTGVSSAS
ncbi:hypothetical protein ES703_114727 [subsurface metagenome]